MALSLTDLNKIYLAYFGRPVDASGLTTFSKMEIGNVIGAFDSSKESQDLYGTDPVAKINAIYKNLFGREAEPEGLKGWLDRLATGEVTPASAALEILKRAQNSDAVAVANKVAAADAFTNEVLKSTTSMVGYGGNAAAEAARNWLSKVNAESDMAKVTAEVAAAVTSVATIGGVEGKTFTLTNSIDNVIGTAGNDTIIGDKTSTNPADQIDGGAGYDTVKLTGFGDTDFTTLPQVKNVEQLSLVGNKSATVDVAAISGLQNVTLENNPVNNTEVKGLTSAISLGLTNVSDNTKTVTGTLGATDAAATLVVTDSKDVGTVALNGAKIDTVNVTSSGAVANKLAALTSTGTFKNLNITGNQALTVTAALANTVAKIDGSASTGGFTLLTAATLNADTTVTGGSGADTLTVGAGASKAVKVALGAGNDKLTLGDLTAYGATSTFDGGEGTDTIVIVDGSKLDATTGKQITGFETLDLAGGKGIYDVSFLAAGNTISTIQVGAALTDVATVKNVATGSAINILATDGKDLTVEVKDAATTKTDSLSFNLGGAAAVVSTKLTAANVETITLNSTSKLATWNNATDKNVVTSLVADKATTLTITGDKTLELTAATAGELTKIDASAFTGNFIMGAATAATSILGGTGNDTLLASAAGSTINAGKGNDAITLDTAAVKDVVILNAGDATAVISAGAMDFTKLESISNFKTGQDVIDLGSFGFTAQQQSAWAVKGTITGAAVGADVANFFVDTGVARGVAVATDGTDQYLFIDANKDGNFNVAGDLVIKLVGADIANFADIGF